MKEYTDTEEITQWFNSCDFSRSCIDKEILVIVVIFIWNVCKICNIKFAIYDWYLICFFFLGMPELGCNYICLFFCPDKFCYKNCTLFWLRFDECKKMHVITLFCFKGKLNNSWLNWVQSIAFDWLEKF